MNGLRYAVAKGDAIKLQELLTGSGTEDINNPIIIEDDRSHTVREETPLITAARLGHVNVVRLLLQKGASVNSSTLGTGMTALHWACARGHVDVVRLLVTSSANVNQVDFVYETPLMEAICSRRIEIVKMLVTCGADINRHINSAHDSNLLFALQTRHRDIGFFLVAAGADLKARNNFGEDILWLVPDMSLDINEVQSMFNFLLGAGCEPTANHLERLKEMFCINSPGWNTIYDKFVHTLTNAKDLQKLCRDSVRKRLLDHTGNLSILSNCYKLPLPYSIQKYIAMGVELDMYCFK